MSVISPDATITLALSVSDRHAAAKWYSEMLGFELMYHADEAGWSEVATNSPGVTIGFGEQAEPASGNAVPVFGIADIETARADLEKAGVRFEGLTETIPEMVSTATFYDPDGNALMLAQVLSNGS